MGKPSQRTQALAKCAYEAYCAATGGISLVTGDVLPGWDQLHDAIKRAWCASAASVRDEILRGGADA